MPFAIADRAGDRQDALDDEAFVGGSGGLSVTGGSETLTGANTYTGATSVGSGATLTLSGPSSLASGTINIASGGTFNDSNGGLSASANVTDNGTFTLGASEAINQLDGSGAVGLGSHTLTLNQGSFGGVIGGTGGLVKAGAGTLTLSGTNTYSGGTTVTGGTVAVSSDANLGSAAGPLALNDGTLHTTASFTTARASSRVIDFTPRAGKTSRRRRKTGATPFFVDPLHRGQHAGVTDT